MSWLFSSGHVVDLILSVMAIEFVALTARRPGTPRAGAFLNGPFMDRVLAFAPGVCLLLALRAALTGASWVWVAMFLALSFPFHLGDLLRRNA